MELFTALWWSALLAIILIYAARAKADTLGPHRCEQVPQ